jgi:hypothetical protein
MINNRIKEVIFKKLCKDLSKAEIIAYEGNLWFIDREKKYWYFEYKKNGDLWWRYDFFENFFLVFSLGIIEYQPLICEWFEEFLNCKVTTKNWWLGMKYLKVEEILNSKVITHHGVCRIDTTRVEEVLNHKITTQWYTSMGWTDRVEDALNHKVNAPHPHQYLSKIMVEEVLNSKVTTFMGYVDSFVNKVKQSLNN